MNSWLQAKLAEPCACASQRSYRAYYYRRESIYFIIGVSSGFALIGANHLPRLGLSVPLLIAAAYVTKHHYDKVRL